MTYHKINGIAYQYCGYGTSKECKCPKGMPVCKNSAEREKRQQELDKLKGETKL